MTSTQVKPAGAPQMDGGDAAKGESERWKLRRADLALRLVAVGLTLVGAVVMGVAEETKTVQLKVVPTLPAIPVTVVAKSTYSSASVYFITVNAVACAYTLLSLLLLSTVKKRRGLPLALAIADLVMVGLLYSGSGAQAAVGVVGHYGNPHVGWKKICDVFTRFCNTGTVAFVASLLGATVYLLIVSLSTLEAYKRS